MRTTRPHRVTITRHYLDGKRCPKGTPGAKPVTERSETWYAWVGGKRVSLKTRDEGQAWVRLRQLLKDRADRAAGITSDATDQARRPLGEHLDDWIESLRSRNLSEARITVLRSHVQRLATLADWQRITDLSEDSCLKALAVLQADPTAGVPDPATGKPRGISAQTRNLYVAHAKQFTRWAARRAKPRRLAADPLEGVEMVSTEADRRHDRRSPTDEEMRRLFGWLEAPEQRTKRQGRLVETRFGMTGRQRALGYKVAMAAGLRALELRSLSRESFDLKAGTVTVQAAYDKRRRKVTLPLPSWLVEGLRTWFRGGGGCWNTLPDNHPGDALRRDLGDAGVEYVAFAADGTPLYFDFHSLRHWYITQLASQPGIAPKTLMELARHSTAQLTMGIYAKAKADDLKKAVDQIPNPGSNPKS